MRPPTSGSVPGRSTSPSGCTVRGPARFRGGGGGGPGCGDCEPACRGDAGAETIPAPAPPPSALRTSKKKTRRFTTAAKRGRGLLRESFESKKNRGQECGEGVRFTGIWFSSGSALNAHSRGFDATHDDGAP